MYVTIICNDRIPDGSGVFVAHTLGFKQEPFLLQSSQLHMVCLAVFRACNTSLSLFLFSYHLFLVVMQAVLVNISHASEGTLAVYMCLYVEQQILTVSLKMNLKMPKLHCFVCSVVR